MKPTLDEFEIRRYLRAIEAVYQNSRTDAADLALALRMLYAKRPDSEDYKEARKALEDAVRWQRGSAP